MKITLKIKRFNPERDDSSREDRFEVDAEPTDRVLDVLMHIKQTRDGSLSFRKSCAHGVCGSDAMRINGKDRLACKTLVKDVAEAEGAEIRIEPLRYFPVERDLIVDQTSFFDRYKAVRPYLINEEPVEDRERVQSPEEHEEIKDPINCILCAACMSACPIPEKTPEFLGPAIIVQASRFNKDSRDRGFDDRLSVLNDPNGVWPCENHFECTKCCPRDIKVTKLINQSKKQIKAHTGEEK